MTALKDVSFTDHLVERISALEGWTSLFGNMWDSSDDAQTMVVAETMIGKVYKQLADGYVQAHSANAFSAITEAVLRGRSQRPFSEAVLRGFSDRLQADASSADTSIDISKWATFATRWAFCDLLAGLVDSPTRTVELNQVCQQMLHQRLTIGLSAAVALPSSSQASRTTTTEEEAAAVEKIKNITQKDLESFQQQVFSSQALARLLSAPWVLAFSDRTAASPEERKELADLLDRTLLAATSRPQLFNFTVPSCHMIHTNLEVRNPSSSEISVFTGRIHSLVSLIRITPTTAARHTAVVALASLFGVDWSRGPTVTSSGSHGLLSYLASPINPRAMASVKNPAPLTLIELSELSSISITAATASGGLFMVAGLIVLAKCTLEITCGFHWSWELRKGSTILCYAEASGRASAEEAFVGEWGLGRILSLGGLLTAVGGDQALAELDKYARSTWLIPSFMTAQRVLGRLAELSLTLLLRSDAAQLGTSGCHDSPGAGARILKEAIGITSLYQAGFLTSQQEGRLTCAEESALLIAISTSQYEPEDRKMTNQPSLFYYSHGGGVLNDLLYRVGHGLASLTFYHCQLATRTIRTNTLRTHFKTLVELRIHPCTPVSSDTVLDVLSACPVLEVLHVRYLSAEVITERGPWTCQHRLRELTAGIQAGQDEEALQPLVFERLAALTRLKMLEILTPIPNRDEACVGFRLECGLGHWPIGNTCRCFGFRWSDRDFDAAGNLPRKKILAMADDHLEHGDAKPIAKIGSRPTAQVAPEAVPDHSAETHGRLGTQRTELGVDLESRSCTV
ncbi:MAG: hypothetical protein J3Q66DRAFT_376202 [Benniella sp.]|nr:MAG: hypothetical protein J3Q66DRAFT_376202 [Benniella sp.]